MALKSPGRLPMTNKYAAGLPSHGGGRDGTRLIDGFVVAR